jgi:hypothetical protein
MADSKEDKAIGVEPAMKDITDHGDTSHLERTASGKLVNLNSNLEAK